MDKPGIEEEKSIQPKLCSSEDMPTMVKSVANSILPTREKLCKNGREPGRAELISGKKKRDPSLARPDRGTIRPT